jgi:hypothetical protein
MTGFNSKRDAAADKLQERVEFDTFLESQDFYELMQTYRHCQIDAHIPFEAVKDALRAVHIEAALAQPAQEPDEWLTGCPECGMDNGCDCDSGTWNPPQPAQPASRVLSGQELTEYQINHKRESEEYMASLNKYLPVIGALAQIESKDAACTDERMCVPCYTGQGTCESTPPAPPQRPWVGLTPEETSGFTQHEMTVVKYVSKVLQEKNT